MSGIVSYGAYLPFWRLPRSAITAALGSGGGKGTRTVASFDEDTTSMGVEAARIALRQAPADAVPADVLFATTAPAYADKTNATAIHAALALPTHVGAYDLIGAVRSNVAACTLADRLGGLAVLSDQRTGLPGGADESAGGDGAVALLFGDGPGVLAESIGGATASGEFLDRWRQPGDGASQQWEERFGEFAYAPLVEEAVTAALKSAQLAAEDVDHAIVCRAAHPSGAGRRPQHRRSGPTPWSTTWPPRWATRAPRTPGCCSPTCSTGPSPARPSPSSSSPTASTSGCCARPRRSPRTRRRAPSPTRSSPGATTCPTPSS